MAIKASCHCGATRFEVGAAPASVTECNCTFGTYTESLCSWGESGPDFTQPRVAVNARLFDDFDLGAIPVEQPDGRNLW